MAFEAGWAKAIRGRAAELGLNQADIGRILGKSKQTGHRIWKGESRPSIEQVDELEEALLFTPGELRVLAGYLPVGEDPKVEWGHQEIIVRLKPIQKGAMRSAHNPRTVVSAISKVLAVVDRYHPQALVA